MNPYWYPWVATTNYVRSWLIRKRCWPMRSLTSRIAPDVSRPKTKIRPVACRLERGSSQSEGRRGSTARRTLRLTRREQQIVNLLLEGCDNAEIAGQLRIAHRTVKAYFNRLFLRFGITSGIKRVKLATFMYRSRLCSDMIFTGSAAQLNGNSASSPSSPRASVTGTSPAKLEPPSTSSRTVFEPSTTSWVCGTVSSLPCGTGREVATAGLGPSRGDAEQCCKPKPVLRASATQCR